MPQKLYVRSAKHVYFEYRSVPKHKLKLEGAAGAGSKATEREQHMHNPVLLACTCTAFGVSYIHINHPSSSHMVVPVMTRDRSDVRKSAALPTSSL